jgi:hypothetical protein
VTALLTPNPSPSPPFSGRPRRGGNRLTPDCYPLRGPVYTRRRSFGPDLERRDRHQRERTRRAVSLALTRGELCDRLAVVMYQLLDHCTDTLLCPSPEGGPACSGWWSRRYIHDLVLPPDHDRDGHDGGAHDDSDRDGDDHEVDDESDDDVDLEDATVFGEVVEGGARTAGRWMAQLAELGWVESIHRYRVVNGLQRGTSNLWRFRIPDHLRSELHTAEDTARAKRAGRRPNRSGPGRATRPNHREATATAAARTIRNEEDRLQAPCPACEGACWVPAPDDPNRGVVRCESCEGSGTTRAGP